MASGITKPTIAILSMGQMGAGVASLLHAHSYRVLTDLSDRSDATRKRAEAAGATSCELPQLLAESDVILSILPPRDALETAQKVSAKLRAATASGSGQNTKALVYFDLNAISPRLSRQVNDVFSSTNATYIDGGIIGGPPKKQDEGGWQRPSIVTSGPLLSSCIGQEDAAALESVLGMRHVNDKVGSASGLKMCYASMTKGASAIAIMAFSTAHRLGVLEELRDELDPRSRSYAERSLVSMQPKAYRWVREMEEIMETFRDDGGWQPELFTGVADVYRTVDEKTNLGESSKDRVEDVAAAIAQALAG